MLVNVIMMLVNVLVGANHINIVEMYSEGSFWSEVILLTMCNVD